MKGLEAHITMKDGAKPIFIKPRRIPYALKEEVEKELDKLEKNGVIVKADRSDWASPIVVVPKADKSVRICGDYKVTINSPVEDEQYPLPTQQDLYAALSRSKFFSKLDLSHAYVTHLVLIKPVVSTWQLAHTRDSIPTPNYHMGLNQHLKYSKLKWI